MKTFKDIDTYKQGESHDKFHVFGKELDAYLKVLPCREGIPVCDDDRADPGKPFFFMYTVVFKGLKLFSNSRGLSALYLPRLTWPRPSCILTAGHSCEPLQSFATTLAIHLL